MIGPERVPMIALLCLLALAPAAAAETCWVLWQNVTVTTTDLDGSNPYLIRNGDPWACRNREGMSDTSRVHHEKSPRGSPARQRCPR